MKTTILLIALISSFNSNSQNMNDYIYHVKKISKPLVIDANWNKPQWKNIQSIHIGNFKGEIPAFQPKVQVKLMYDSNFIYGIFRVDDKFVRCITDSINGPVWQDACVEFFFSPDNNLPEAYFNLEINCGGTPLFFYHTDAEAPKTPIDLGDIKSIEIAHTMPKITDPEITDSITWFIEFKLPIEMLKKYTTISTPSRGTYWKANFYKIARNNTNPHGITWALLDKDVNSFHSPEYFGKLLFK
jgi:hypothetical protein